MLDRVGCGPVAEIVFLILMLKQIWHWFGSERIVLLACRKASGPSLLNAISIELQESLQREARKHGITILAGRVAKSSTLHLFPPCHLISDLSC
ncbi:hypothetical protein Plhal304r1_c030g0098641 [Plasmopara halstedii]